MNTFEKFCFKADELQIGGGGDGTDFSLTFFLTGGDPFFFQIRVRGKDEFRKVVQRIRAVGEAMTDPSGDK